MKPTEVARIVGVSVDTVKRWLSTYPEVFSPGAIPPSGRQRVLNEHDLRVLMMIVALRDAGQSGEEVATSLKVAQDDNWRDLPPLPVGVGESIPTDLAAGRAAEMVESAVLARELQLVRQQLLEATERAEKVEDELEAMRTERRGTEAAQHALELELERARGEISTLQARLSAYTLGGEKPISVALIIAATAIVVVLLVVLVFVVARLVM